MIPIRNFRIILFCYMYPPLFSIPLGGGFQVARKNKLGKITMQYLSPNLYPILSPLPSATPLPPIDQSTFGSALPRQH